MRRFAAALALLAMVVADVSASAQARPHAQRPHGARAQIGGRVPHASNTSNTAYRNQMKKFSNPLGANGR